MKEQEDSNKEVLATIDRRFQFLSVIAVFLPFVWSDLQNIAPATSLWLLINSKISPGVIISYTFINYLLFEIVRNYIVSKKFLRFIAMSLIALSYTLIAVVVFGSGQPSIPLSGWKFVFLEMAFIAGSFLSAIISFIIVYSPAVYFFRLVLKKLKNGGRPH
jgi:hypothetical protein